MISKELNPTEFNLILKIMFSQNFHSFQVKHLQFLHNLMFLMPKSFLKL